MADQQNKILGVELWLIKGEYTILTLVLTYGLKGEYIGVELWLINRTKYLVWNYD